MEMTMWAVLLLRAVVPSHQLCLLLLMPLYLIKNTIPKKSGCGELFTMGLQRITMSIFTEPGLPLPLSTGCRLLRIRLLIAAPPMVAL
jgi:hypothetical protein